ncbi:MAG: transposase [Solobacterium sp.]|nr:transposase [Solobacterium sp.]
MSRMLGNRFRIYPNTFQISAALQILGSCRYVYNLYLNAWSTCIKYTGKSLSYLECCRSMSDLMKVLPWLRNIEVSALQSSLRSLERAFRFAPNHPPAYHKRGHNDSYTCKNTNFCIRKLDKNHILLPQLGKVRVRGLRDVKGKILSAAVTYESTGKWFCSFLYQADDAVRFFKTGKTVGIDLGIHDFLILSDGTKIPNPRILSTLEKKLRKAQRSLSRKRSANISHFITVNASQVPVFKRPFRECRNYQKQKRRVARIYEKIRNCRRDFEHKLSIELIKSHDVLCMEDLNVKSMLGKDRNLSKQISDVSWSEFNGMLEYKAKWYGRRILRVSRYYPSSQICHVCGRQNPALKDLTIREWECPVCHTIHDRDINAAMCIKKEALRRNTMLLS